MRSQLFFLFSTGVSTIAVTITGPSSLLSCEVSHFSFSDGVAPYTFVAMAGAGAASGSVDQTSLPVFGTETVYLPTVANSTPMRFYVVDSTNIQSNVLTLTIESTGTCVSSLSASQVTSDLGPFVSTPTGPSSSLTTRPSDFINSQTNRTGATTSARFAMRRAVVALSLTSEASTRPSTSSIFAVALCLAGSVLGGLIFALCYLKRRRARGSHVINPDTGDEARWNMPESRPTLGGAANNVGDADSQLVRSSTERVVATAPLAALTLPSSKELRMRGAVQRLVEAESGTSISGVSSEYSSAHNMSIWPSASGSGRENVTQRQRDAEAQQNLQALINRELQEMLRNNLRSPPPLSAPSPSPMASNPFLSSEEKDPASLEWDQRRVPSAQKSPPTLSIPQTPGTEESRSRLASATNPISHSDMEVLADLVARRLLRDRGASSSNSMRDVPPPSYS